MATLYFIGRMTCDNPEYKFSGYFKIWASFNIGGAPSNGQYIGQYSILEDGNFNIQIDSDLFFGDNTTGAYHTIQARYYLNGKLHEYYLAGIPQNNLGVFITTNITPTFTFKINVDQAPISTRELTILVKRNDLVNIAYPLINNVLSGLILDKDNEEIQNLGQYVSTDKGYVQFFYERVNNVELFPLKIKLTTEEGWIITQEIADADIQTLTLIFTAGLTPLIESISLFGLMSILPTSTTHYDPIVKENVRGFFQNNNVFTLNQLRLEGDIRNYEGYDSLPDDEIILAKRIEASSKFELLLFENEGINSNFYLFFDALESHEAYPVFSALDVVNKFTADDFFNHAKELELSVSDFQINKFYHQAKAQVNLFSTLIAGARGKQNYSDLSASDEKLLTTDHPVTCQCEDCVSAVSPLSYLVSLLEYTKQHVRVGSSTLSPPLDLTRLMGILKQPIGQLTASCKDVTEKICNYRAAVEILYNYFDDLTPVPAECQSKQFYFEKRNFLEVAYAFLLEAIGTSYTEIRANLQNDEKLEQISNRIGIPFKDDNNVILIKKLYRDIEIHKYISPIETEYITYVNNLEVFLQDYFGFAKDSQNPFATLAQAFVTGYQLSYLQDVWLKEEIYSDSYVEKLSPIINPSLMLPDDIRLQVNASSSPVNYYSLNANNKNIVFQLWENRRKWLDNAHTLMSNDQNFYSVAGFELGEQIIKLDFGHNAMAEVFEGSKALIYNSNPLDDNFDNIGTYSCIKYNSFTPTPSIDSSGLFFSEPLKSKSISQYARVKFNIVYKISGFSDQGGGLVEFTSAADFCDKKSTAHFYVYNFKTGAITEMTFDSYTPGSTTMLGELPEGMNYADFESLFDDTGTDVKLVFEVDIAIFPQGSQDNMYRSVHRGVSYINVFGALDNTNEFDVTDKQFDLEEAGLNSGSYIAAAVTEETYDVFSTLNANPVTITKIQILGEGAREYIYSGKGEGKISYLVENLAISSISGKQITLATPPSSLTNLSTILSAGQKISASISGGSVELTVTQVSGFIISVLEVIPVTVTTSSLISFKRYVNVVQQFPLIDVENTNKSIFGIFTNIPNGLKDDFQYEVTYPIPAPPVPPAPPAPPVYLNPKIWNLTNNSLSLLNQLEIAANDIKNGINSNLINELNLSKDSLLRLYEIYKKYRSYLQFPNINESPSEAEYKELIAIFLSSAQKAYSGTNTAGTLTNWLLEEKDMITALNTSYGGEFVSSADYRIIQFAQKEASFIKFDDKEKTLSPVIDGLFVSQNSIPTGFLGTQGRIVQGFREQLVSQQKSNLFSTFYSSGIDAVLAIAFAKSIVLPVETYLTNLQTQIDSIDPDVQKRAEYEIVNAFGLNRDSFLRLQSLRKTILEVQAELMQNNQTNAELNELISIILPAYQQLELYPIWINNNKDLMSISSTNQKGKWWLFEKMEYIPWTVNTKERQDWKNSILNRSANVNVDPDILSIQEFKVISNVQSDYYQAYKIYSERKTTLSAWYVDVIDGTVVTSINNWLEKFRYIVCKALDISHAEWNSLLIDDDNGVDIFGRLQQLNLSTAAFYRLKNLIKLFPNNTTPPGPLTEEKNELQNIVVSIIKYRHQTNWKYVEITPQANPGGGYYFPVILSNAFFQIHDPIYSPYPSERVSYIKWRGDASIKQKWSRKLKARTEQYDNVNASLKFSVKEAEDRYLILLRDAYINYVGEENKTLEQNAKTLSDNLYFDFKQSCCMDTNRVSVAITSIQLLLWSERTGLLEDNDHDLVLKAPNFDAEWKWIGSYATWRSAMFVFIYPENLLHPLLRKDYTPCYAKIMDTVNNGGGRFTPETACELAKSYETYFQDISNIEVKATCTADMILYQGKCTEKIQTSMKPYFFAFGLSKVSSKVYFNMSPGSTTLSKESGYWEEVTGFTGKVIHIAGSFVYKTSSEKRYLYLVVMEEIEGENQLSFIKLDLEKQVWDEEAQELSIDDGLMRGQAIVVQKYDETSAPVIFYKRYDSEWSHPIFMNKLNAKGDDWAIDEPILVSSGNIGFNFNLVSSVVVGNYNESSYQFSCVIVYKHIWYDHIWIQNFSENKFELPYTFNSANIHWNLNIEWTGDYYDTNTIKNAWFHGLYSIPSSAVDKKFSLLISSSYSGSVKQLEIKSSEVILADNQINNLKKFNDFLLKYTFLDLKKEYFGTLEYGNSQKMEFTDVYSTLNKLNPSLPLSEAKVAAKKESVATERNTTSGLEYYTESEITDVIRLGVFDRLGWFYNKMINENSNWIYANKVINNHLKVLGTNDVCTLEIIFKLLTYVDLSKIPVLKNNTSTFVIIHQNLVSGIRHLSPNFYKYTGVARTFCCGIKSNRSYKLWFNKSILNYFEIYNGYSSPMNPIITNADNIIANVNSDYFQLRKGYIQNNYSANQSFYKQMTYLAEAYLFIPQLIALKLQENGFYTEALDWFRSIYDYTVADVSKRKIYYGLVAEESVYSNYNLAANWLLDPLDPHRIALTRRQSYTISVLSNLSQCFIAYADDQFTQDTVETVSRARELYEEALTILRLPVLSPDEEECTCDNVFEQLMMGIKCKYLPQVVTKYKDEIYRLSYLLSLIKSCDDRNDVIAAVIVLLKATTLEAGIITSDAKILLEIENQDPPQSLSNLIEAYTGNTNNWFNNLFTVSEYNNLSQELAVNVSQDLAETFEIVTGYNSTSLNSSASLPFLSRSGDTGTVTVGYTQGNQTLTAYRSKTPFVTSEFAEMNDQYVLYPNGSLGMVDENIIGFDAPPMIYNFCIPKNPTATALKLKTELNLFKLRNCMNIAGMVRELDPFAAPTDATSGLPSIGEGGQLVLPGNMAIKPTQYRYEVIVERAKQLVQQAQQVESMYLASLEKRDAEAFSILKAKQELKTAKANVRLQDLRIKVAEGEVLLAELQRERSVIQVDQLTQLINAGLNAYELTIMDAYAQIKVASDILTASQLNSIVASGIGAVYQVKESVELAWTVGALYATTATLAGIGGLKLNEANFRASYNSILAGLENRRREWGYQQVMANQDIRIGDQQVKVAEARLRVSGQEKKIAEIQQESAEDTINFLNNKFTNVELYAWMSRILGNVYGNMLQQATATAKMAANQLAFERQELPNTVIADDYWEGPSTSVTLQGGGVDRRGLTGSTRLLQDITRLDQYAFNSDKRKLELSKTFSLASLAPLEFQQFRDSGVLTFSTLLEHFDRDFPGQYMRTIKKVRTSVIALVPPNDGIKANLSSSGISQVVLPGIIFQKNVIRRNPETVSFTSPINATGMFEMQMENKFLNPFEGSGVAGLWEFSMPKESNLIDYNTIADVLITIEYTAFYSWDYKQQVLRTLPLDYSAERIFSFRQEFPDQFYELAHPEELENPFAVSFKTSRFDFPANLKDFSISGIKILISTTNGQQLELEPGVVSLGFTEENSTNSAVGAVNLNDKNFASSRTNSQGLSLQIGKLPFGEWSLDFNTPAGNPPSEVPGNYNQLKSYFDDGIIQDILFIVEFNANYVNANN